MVNTILNSLQNYFENNQTTTYRNGDSPLSIIAELKGVDIKQCDEQTKQDLETSIEAELLERFAQIPLLLEQTENQQKLWNMVIKSGYNYKLITKYPAIQAEFIKTFELYLADVIEDYISTQSV